MGLLEELEALKTTGAYHKYRVDAGARKVGMHHHLQRQLLHGHVHNFPTGHASMSKSVFRT